MRFRVRPLLQICPYFLLVTSWSLDKCWEDAMKLLLRVHLYGGQGAIRLKLPRGHMSSKPYYMRCRISMLSCLCEYQLSTAPLEAPSLMMMSRLIFMTYNGWVMVAVSVGAFVGYLFFGTNTSSTKDTACHWVRTMQAEEYGRFQPWEERFLRYSSRSEWKSWKALANNHL
jgi:copper transporter 1